MRKSLCVFCVSLLVLFGALYSAANSDEGVIVVSNIPACVESITVVIDGPDGLIERDAEVENGKAKPIILPTSLVGKTYNPGMITIQTYGDCEASYQNNVEISLASGQTVLSLSGQFEEEEDQ